jgi:UDP-3-O-[3-hydroxymyristoyl] glucosamine N-acyltransferase
MFTFFKNKGPFDINYLLKKTLFTNKSKFKKQLIKNVSTLSFAKKGDLTFFENSKYLHQLKNTKASYCLIKESHIDYLNLKTTLPIISINPLIDFIIITSHFYPDANKDVFPFKVSKKFKSLTKDGTFIDTTVKIGKNFSIGCNTILKKNIIIGKNVKIGSNCVISNSIIDDNVQINDNSVIGKIGFGFKYFNNCLNFIPHIGHVKICENVYIGSSCTIDRGSFTNTIIGKNTMIDNSVHIAHNVKIGSNCIIAGQVGIAGSTNVGDNCMIGGQAGISGHLNIGKNVHIGGHSGVLNNIEDNQKIMGYPAVSIKEFLKRSKI